MLGVTVVDRFLLIEVRPEQTEFFLQFYKKSFRMSNTDMESNFNQGVFFS